MGISAQISTAGNNAVPSSAFKLGLTSALITTCIWAAWLISVKLGTVSQLTSFDLAMFRYGVPGLVFSWSLYQARKSIKKTPLLLLVGMCLGAGFPFFFFGFYGMSYAPLSHAGLLIPGTMPLFVTAIAVFILKEIPTKQRLLGLTGICVGIALVVYDSLQDLNSTFWKGDLLFLGASICWSIYSVCLRLSGIPPLAAVSLYGLTSTASLLIFLGLGWVHSDVLTAAEPLNLNQMLIQFGIQCVLVGLITGFSYGFAIQRIGAENTTAIGALAPVLATVGSLFLFDEIPSTLVYTAMVCITLGVVIASGVGAQSQKPSANNG